MNPTFQYPDSGFSPGLNIQPQQVLPPPRGLQTATLQHGRLPQIMLPPGGVPRASMESPLLPVEFEATMNTPILPFQVSVGLKQYGRDGLLVIPANSGQVQLAKSYLVDWYVEGLAPFASHRNRIFYQNIPAPSLVIFMKPYYCSMISNTAINGHLIRDLEGQVVAVTMHAIQIIENDEDKARVNLDHRFLLHFTTQNVTNQEEILKVTIAVHGPTMSQSARDNARILRERYCDEMDRTIRNCFES